MRIANPVNVSLLNPKGHPLSFSSGNLNTFQISILENDLIRIEHFPDGKPRIDRTWMVIGFKNQNSLRSDDVPLEGRTRSDLSGFSLPKFHLSNLNGIIHIYTEQIHLKVNLQDFSIQWFNSKEQPFAADLPGRSYPYDQSNNTIYHYMVRRSDEHYYGFGERAGPLDKYGMRMRMVNLDALGYDAETSDPLYKHFPFYITFIPDLNIAYGLFYDNLANTIFDMGKEVDNYYPAYRYYQADNGDLDYYMIFGPSIQEVVRKFSRLTGLMVLPPRWSLGYLGSTMTYTESSDAQEQLQHFVELCQKHQIPCNLFHLSSGYGTSEEGKRYVFNWNLKKIPNPQKLVTYFHKNGIRLAANIKPALLTTHPRYSEVAEQGAFIHSAQEDVPELSAFWGGKGAHIDFTNPAGYNWWKQRVLDRILAYGIDATWNDNNEFPIWDDDARCDGFGNSIPVGLIRPLQPLLMTRASYEAQLINKPNERPFLLTRSGCPGIQRYAQSWSGDNYTSWKTLRFNIPMGLGLSLSGAPNTGHDVGGFAGRKPEPELFVRWVQNGIFHPRFTIHSWNEDNTVNEPWMHLEVLPIIRQSIEFRYRLIPYLYSLFWSASWEGTPIIRPMVYHFPSDHHCHSESFDFMLGPNLLVASIVEKNARSRKIYLPSRHDWCNFHTGEWYKGGNTIELDAPLEYIPLLVPAGGIIPMGKVIQDNTKTDDDLRQILVFPHPNNGKGQFSLYEDDGISFDYQKGIYSEINFKVTSNQNLIFMQVSYLHNKYPLSYRQLEFILPQYEERTFDIDHLTEHWVDDQNRHHYVLPVEKIIKP